MSYHEQITTCHPDYADVRERLHDVIKSGGREGVNTGGRVLRNAPMDNLETNITILNIHRMQPHDFQYLYWKEHISNVRYLLSLSAI